MTGSLPDVPADRGQELILRVLDVVLSLIGLILAAPLFPVLAVLIKLDSRGPVFYAAPRIGKDMKPFRMYKLRTMVERSEKIDRSICPHSDPRVTAIGQYLRQTKLNELPQLFNILKGDMSFVGTRPEAPDLAVYYPEEAQKLLAAKPGLVGPAVISSLRGEIHGRHEDELYPPGVDPVRYYVEHILPEKLKIDLAHRSHKTVANYFRIIFLALKETVFGAFGARQGERPRGQVYLYLGDMALSQISYALAFLIVRRLSGVRPPLSVYLTGFLLVGVARSLFHYGIGLYDFVIELISPRDAYHIFRAVGIGSLIMMAFSAFLGSNLYPPLLALLDFVLLGAMLTGLRLFLTSYFRLRDKAVAEARRPRVLIFGANRHGLAALNALGGLKISPYKVVGFVDDAPEKYHKKIGGVRVLGSRHDIQALAVLLDVREIILAPDDEIRARLDEIVALCVRAGVRSRVFSYEQDEGTREFSSYPLRPVLLSDVLPRVPTTFDQPALRKLLTDRTVLMLGSGGQLGSSICRAISESGGRKVVIVDRWASSLWLSLAELRSDLPGFQIVPVVLDSRNIEALEEVFVRHRPQIVIHAGMRKFLTLQKPDLDEVARSNYFRTFNLAKVASLHGCEYFLVISSIKATCRGNFVSDSLRVAELSLNIFFNRTSTRLIVTRVGNIIENQGGVVSWLNDKILEQKPLRLPAETAKTYLLSKSAASRYILQGLVLGSFVSPGGSLLTAEPGVGLRLFDVARKIASLYGLAVGTDIPFKFNEIPNGVIDDEPASVLEASRESGRTLSLGPSGDQGFSLMEKVFLSGTSRVSWKELRRQTEEIISMLDSVAAPPSRESMIH